MAHQVESMMFVGATPWHGLGLNVQENISITDAIIASGLDWEVEKVGLVTADDHKPAKSAFGIRRVSDKRILGTTGKSYRPLQNLEAFNFFQPYLDNKLCNLHTAGSLCEGEKVWVLANIIADPLEIVKGDMVEQFLMITNTHDGKTAVQVGFTPIRVVCANTLRMAQNSKNSKLIRVRHSMQVVQNIEALRETMDLAKAEFEGTAEQYRVLAGKQIVTKDLEKYFRVVLDIDVDKARKDLPTRTQNRLDEMFKLFETGKGSDIEGVKGSLWGAYNAVTESLSWTASRNLNNRFDSLWFGTADKINALALETALAMAA